MMEPLFFATPADLRKWFEQHYETEKEVSVGYYKKSTGIPSITWEESVDQALCFGWIDGIRRGIDDKSYKIRFTPRKPRSIWSAVNIQKVAELTEQGLMLPAGLEAFNKRTQNRSEIYAYEQSHNLELPADYREQLNANEAAKAFFDKKPPSYQRSVIYWILSAKKDETKLKRLATLIEDSANGRTVAPFTYTPKPK